jgi:hypothetical protein
MNTTPTTHTSSIKYDRTTRDFSVTIDGALIGFAPSVLAGEAMARDFIASQIAHDTQCQAAEVAPTVAPTTTPITTAAIAAALSTARAKVADNARWMTALNKASLEIISTPWVWYGHTLKIKSRTASTVWYTVTATSCGCQAFAKGNACWHRAAFKLLSNAQAATPAAPVQPVRTSQADVDFLFN